MRTFEELAAGPITEQVENMIETDPTVAMLTQQLALQGAALAGLRSRLGENHREMRRVRGLVNETRERRQKRRC